LERDVRRTSILRNENEMKRFVTFHYKLFDETLISLGLHGCLSKSRHRLKTACTPYAETASLKSGARALLCWLALLLAIPTAAEPLKISGAMPPFGQVSHSWLAPSGQYAVFIADRATDFVFDLWSAATTGGTPNKLTSFALSGSGVNVEGVRISPNGQSVVFLAQMGSNIEPSLWSIPITGGTATQISTGATLIWPDFKISPDSSRVLYRQNDPGTPALVRTVAVAGGAVTTLSAVPLGLAAAGSPEFTPDGLTAVYTCTCLDANVTDLFRVPITGGASTKLSGNAVASANGVVGFKIAANGSRVAFHGKLDSATRVRLYSASLSGAADRQTLSGSGVASGVTADIEDSSRYQISPDSTRVVYILTLLTTPDVGEDLFSAPLAGGPAMRLNATTNGLPGTIKDWTITPDSSRVVWIGTEPVNSTAENCRHVITAPIATANARLKIAGDPQNRDGYSAWVLRITPDSQRVVFAGSLEGQSSAALYSVPTSGGATVALTGASTVAPDVPSFNSESATARERARQEFLLTRDGTRVLYRGGYFVPSTTLDRYGLWSVPVAGGATLLLSGGYEYVNIHSFFATSQTPATDLVSFRSLRSSFNNIELFVTDGGISAAYSALDVDGDKSVTAATDGVLLVRWLLGFRNTALTTGALGVGATRNASQIDSYLTGLIAESGL
jgi:Tol biopolymer transport system component